MVYKLWNYVAIMLLGYRVSSFLVIRQISKHNANDDSGGGISNETAFISIRFRRCGNAEVTKLVAFHVQRSSGLFLWELDKRNRNLEQQLERDQINSSKFPWKRQSVDVPSRRKYYKTFSGLPIASFV